MLDDPAVKKHAVEFARSLLDDRALQQQGSDALWKTIKGTFSFKQQQGQVCGRLSTCFCGVSSLRALACRLVAPRFR